MPADPEVVHKTRECLVASLAEFEVHDQITILVGTLTQVSRKYFRKIIVDSDFPEFLLGVVTQAVESAEEEARKQSH